MALTSSPYWPLFVHLRLHYQLVFLSPLFAWGFLLGGGAPSIAALVAFVAFHVFLYGGMTAYNSYYDRDEGPVGGLRAPPPATEPLLGFSVAVQAFGLIASAFVGVALALLYTGGMLLSVAYSHPRFRWKARPILSLFVVALGQGALGFTAGYLCGATPVRPLFGSVEGLLGLTISVLITVGFYPLTQVYQIGADRVRGDRTFAVAFGGDASFKLALVCVALAGACMVPLVARLFGGLDAIFLALVFGALLGVIARWQRRFREGAMQSPAGTFVMQNFVTLHRLQAALSLGTLGYVGLRLVLG